MAKLLAARSRVPGTLPGTVPGTSTFYLGVYLALRVPGYTYRSSVFLVLLVLPATTVFGSVKKIWVYEQQRSFSTIIRAAVGFRIIYIILTYISIGACEAHNGSLSEFVHTMHSREVVHLLSLILVGCGFLLWMIWSSSTNRPMVNSRMGREIFYPTPVTSRWSLNPRWQLFAGISSDHVWMGLMWL